MFDDYSFEPLIKKILDELYNNEPELFNLDSNQEIERHVGERAIVFRFGLYFQKALDECGRFTDYYLDCEYNRNVLDPKKLKETLIVPDLILHKRRNNDDNRLVLEFKGWWNLNQGHDEKKIKGLIDKKGKFRYHEGYTILLGRDRNSTNVNSILL